LAVAALAVAAPARAATAPSSHLILHVPGKRAPLESVESVRKPVPTVHRMASTMGTSSGDSLASGATTNSLATPSTLFWSTLATFDQAYASVVDVGDGGQRILYQVNGGAYYVFDRATGSSRRVDTYFDGTPLPGDIWRAAMSGDGSTVVFLRNPEEGYEPTLRIVRLDQGENFEVELPDPGEQTWSSGWVEQCSILTRLGDLHVDDDGSVAWLTDSPCYYDKLLALDISSSTLHWRFITAFRHYTSEVTADGKHMALGGDFFYDYNWNQVVDPGEPEFGLLFVAPLEFFNNDAEPGNAVLNWPDWNYMRCNGLPVGSRARLDGGGDRLVLTTDEVGLDPETIVYTAGQQLYWGDRHCNLHSLGPTEATEIDQLRISIDGRAVLHKSDTGAVRTEIATGQGTDYNGLDPNSTDPFLLSAAWISQKLDATGVVLGSVLQAAQLSGLPSGLKVAILGDSYISGEGSYGYMPGTDVHGSSDVKDLCHRSVSSWAYQVGQRLAAFRLNSAHPLLKTFACSGATTWNVEHGQYTEESQIDQLRNFNADGGRPVDVAFVSMGGNDAGFKSIIETCIAIKCLSSRWEHDRLVAAEAAAARVETTLEHIKAAAPHATVFLTGYPSIVDPPNGDCAELGLTATEQALLGYATRAGGLISAAGGLRVDKHEQAWLNDTLIPSLNLDLSRAAAEAGVRWIDPAGWFHGHGVCSSYPFGHGLASGDDFPSPKPFLGNESFHPNPDGYAQMAARVEFGFGSDFHADNNPPPIPQGINHDEPADSIGAMVVDGRMEAWGDSGHVTIQNLPDGSKVALGMFSSPTLLGQGTVGSDGTLTLPYEVPTGLYPGLHVLVAYDEETGEPLATGMTEVSPPEECLDRESDVDRDGDYLADRCDASFVDGPGADEDGDGIENAEDDCPSQPDANQLDEDENGIGDACDPSLGFNPAEELKPFPEVQIPRPGPKISVLSRPGYYSGPDVEVSFSVASDEAAVGLKTQCSVDSVPIEPCTSPVQLEGLSEGYHYIQIKAEDSNGEDSASVSWSVDTTPPVPSVSVPQPGQHFPYESSTPPVYNCDTTGGPLLFCSASSLETYLPGEHVFTLSASDPAGHTASVEVPYVVDAPPWWGAGEGGEFLFGESSPLPPGRVHVSGPSRRGRQMVLTLRCSANSSGCSGVTVNLKSLAKASVGGRGRLGSGRLLGQVRLDLAAASSTVVALPLNRRGKALCRQQMRARARLEVTQGRSVVWTGSARPCPLGR
jgi:lysophospholipase L1-like esterase